MKFYDVYSSEFLNIGTKIFLKGQTTMLPLNTIQFEMETNVMHIILQFVN